MRPARPIHPLLFAAFPVLFLYARGLADFSPGVILLPLLICAALAFSMWGLARLILPTWQRAALLASLLLFLFLSYGHLHSLLGDLRLRLGPLLVGPDRVLFPACLAALAAGAVLLARTRRSLDGMTRFANLLGLFFLAGSLVQIGLHPLTSRGRGSDRPATEQAVCLSAQGRAVSDLPHIFYIILDGYARADVLADLYGYENPLVGELRERGFYVAHKGRANYCQTTLSLASSLSMEYLDELAERIGRDSEDRRLLRRRIKRSRVARYLRALGYTYVAFATGYYSTEARNADHFWAPGFSLDEFQSTLLGTTPIPAVLKLLGNAYQDDLHRERVVYTLQHLVDVCDLTDPAFVLAHVVAPHPPFVFGPRGAPLEARGRFTLADGSDLVGPGGLTAVQYRELYRDQLVFINSQILAALDALLAREDRPAIIILQGDHGPGSGLIWEDADRSDMRERLGILNAYRFPDRAYGRLHDEISPVNTFRVVFSQYFGADLPQLPDRSFFSTESHPYRFVDVTARTGG
jgi:hypothetical protein